VVSVMRKTDLNAVKSICARLGIKYETDAENRETRNEVLHCLSRDVAMLGQLAKRGPITLYDLSINGLLPKKLGCTVSQQAPDDKTKCNETNAFYYKDIGDITDIDQMHFAKIWLVGKKAMSMLTALANIHRETCGFKTLLQPTATTLTATEEISLIGRIMCGLRDDPNVRCKLRAMFPTPAP